MIPFNPCGRAVDWLSNGYTTWARFWDDPDAPLVRLIWYPTDLPFLDYATVFGSHEWETDYPDLRGLGEIRRDRPARKNWHPGIPGLTGDHVCGTPDQFLFGAPRYTGPPIVYDADHIPLCCGRRPVAFVTGGARPSALVVYVPNTRAQLTVGARPASTVALVTRPRPALTIGARPASTVRVTTGIVGVIGGGAGPASVVVQTSSYVGRVGAGAYPAATVPPHERGEVTAGARPAAWVAIVASCPGPTSTCGASVLGGVGHNCDYTYAPLDTDSWRSWATVPGHAYRLHVESALGTYGFEIWEGTDCGDLNLLTTGSMSSTPGDFDFATTSERVLVHWSYPFGTLLHVIIGLEDIT